MKSLEFVDEKTHFSMSKFALYKLFLTPQEVAFINLNSYAFLLQCIYLTAT